MPLIGSIKASSTENDYETDTGELGVVTVTMDGYAKATVGLTDRQFLESSSASLTKFAVQMGSAVASEVITGVFGKITKANYPTALAPTAGMTMMDLLTLAREKFGELKVSKANRTYFPSASAYTALAKDPAVQVASAMAYGGTEYIRDGVIPRLLGFDLFESTILPTSSAAPNGFIVHPSALAVATRAVTPSEPKAYLESRTAIDTDTGITSPGPLLRLSGNSAGKRRHSPYRGDGQKRQPFHGHPEACCTSIKKTSAAIKRRPGDKKGKYTFLVILHK